MEKDEDLTPLVENEADTCEHIAAYESGETEIETMLDSGACDHVMDPGEPPGYELEASPGSKAGKVYTAADGSAIENLRQVRLKLDNGARLQVSNPEFHHASL